MSVVVLWRWGLASARLWALLRVQPSWRAILGRRWEWCAAALAVSLALGPALSASAEVPELPASLLGAGVAVGFELLLGGVLGLIGALGGWALIGAAGQSEAGLGVGAGEGQGSLATALIAASLAAGLSLGVHVPALRAGLGLFARFELGAPQRWALSLELGRAALLPAVVEASVLAVALATPVLLTRALVDLVVGALARGPEPSATLIAAVLPGLRAAAALIALGAAWSVAPQAFAQGL
ncbi:hypothetical protein G6O69_03040 [Pseudenhygromyxa sp. WMMC2535]|uniref:hypothetical protein n=1 Tax=Pseudenhygromyxa sp. WMMC2535 TaxID=2712867 RepID=UPI0015554691|nr:hypothetical protein [Pseudenhygromyxa sp. WMMC2535]NVB36793.1 hypothetical protein [Pseudenhygromyxa sp. WMMC2535]